MNWKRIVVFIAIMFVATAAAGFPFGFIAGFLHAQGKAIPAWVGIGPMVFAPAAMVAVYAWLTAVQADRPFAHAFGVALGTWLLSFPLNVLLFRQPVAQWLLGIAVLMVTAVIGALIGKAIRRPKPAEETEVGQDDEPDVDS